MPRNGQSSRSFVEGFVADRNLRWTIAALLVVGIVVYVLIGGFASDDGCGESPPYLATDDRICFVVGYEGPFDEQRLIPILDLSLDEAEQLAAEEGWTLYVKRRSDGLDPDPVPTGVDVVGIELDGDRVERVWPE